MRYPSFDRVTLSGLLLFASSCASPGTVSSAAAMTVTATATQARSPMTQPASKEATEEGAAKPSGDDNELVALLSSSKLGLAEGIALVERKGGTAISAKFELENGKLSLSVYTAKAGIGADAEHNVLVEVSGDPTQPEWNTNEEVFSDIKHITRASYHLTLVQRSRMSLAAVISKAQAAHPGQVYAVEPAIHERSPIFHVAIATAGGAVMSISTLKAALSTP
jgi:hypothetical protein